MRTIQILVTITGDLTDNAKQVQESAERTLGALFPSGEFGGLAELESITVLSGTRKMDVVCPIESKGRTFKSQVGHAYQELDGTTRVYLDAFPANGKLTIERGK